jgi:hypothetical protein
VEEFEAGTGELGGSAGETREREMVKRSNEAEVEGRQKSGRDAAGSTAREAVRGKASQLA